MLSSGTIEEKIYQRQVTKMSLSSTIVEQQTDDTPSFSNAELRNLFTLRTDTICDTHDLLGCRCCASLSLGGARGNSAQVGALMKWDHVDDISNVSVRGRNDNRAIVLW